MTPAFDHARGSIQDGIDEAEAIRRPVALGEFYGFVDYDFGGHVRTAAEFLEPEQQDGPADYIYRLDVSVRLSRDQRVQTPRRDCRYSRRRR